ncbi:MAG TPA: malto-oligosyltrehalose synthase, partial [Phormidium sp.]
LAFLKEIKEKAKADVLKLIDELFTSKEDGRIKLFLIARVLEARKQNLAVFQKGDYVPLEVNGKFQERIVAFARSYENRVAITIVPRLLTNVVQEGEYPLGEVWGDTQLKLPQGMPSAMKDAITSQSLIANGTVLIADALKHFPVALLISESDR